MNLCIDSTSFGVITKDTAQIKSIVDSMYSSSCDVFVPVFDKGGPLFFSIIQSNNQFEFFQNIDSVKLKIASTPFTIITPCFKRYNQGRKGLTNRFYVQLRDEGDTLLLKEYVTSYDVEILYAIPYMPDWFVLSYPYNSPLDALDMANLFLNQAFLLLQNLNLCLRANLPQMTHTIRINGVYTTQDSIPMVFQT